jgi:hypothetical protein
MLAFIVVTLLVPLFKKPSAVVTPPAAAH